MKVSDEEVQIHLNCYNYGKDEEMPLMEIKRFPAGATTQAKTKTNGIIILLKGAIKFSFGKIFNQYEKAGSMFLLPFKYDYYLEALEDTALAVFRLDLDLSFCDHFSFAALYREKNEKKWKEKDICILRTNTIVDNFMKNVVAYLEDGLYCNYLMELKLRELLYILKYYYPTQELKDFFLPMLCDDFEFAALIRKTYTPQLTVQNLARKLNYSISGFEKRFKKVFDMSPYQWIQAQRAKSIYHEITCTTKTFAELGYDYGFSSPSHFSNFCKQVFKNTPGQIRRQK